MIAEKLRTIMMDVLFRLGEVPDGKAPDDAVIVDGITQKFGFHPGRLESHRSEIQNIIAERVPDGFLTGGGGGLSFLQLAQDRNGRIWAEHRTLEEFCCLAIGLKLAGWCLPRAMWGALPGSMPYVWFASPK